MAAHVEPVLPLATADLVWQITKRNHNGLKTDRNDTSDVFVGGTHNLLNLNRRKFSHLGNAKSVSVVANRKGKKQQGGTIVLTNNESNTPAKASTRTRFRRNLGNSISKARSKVQGHRSDMTQVALARIGRIIKSQRPKVATKAAKQAEKAQ